MSIEFKNSRWGRNRNSRLFKKTRRAAMKKIDAPHLPMRVQTGKNEYWGQTSNYPVHIPYGKIHKFLKARIGKPIDKVFSEFLVEARKFRQSDNIEEAFYYCIDYESNKCRGVSKGFYISNGILNYRNDYKKSRPPKKFIEYNKKHWKDNSIDLSEVLHTKGPAFINKLWVEVKGQYMLLPVYIIQAGTVVVRKDMIDDSKEFVGVKIVGKSNWISAYYSDSVTPSILCYYIPIVKIADIEKYKKETFKK